MKSEEARDLMRRIEVEAPHLSVEGIRRYGAENWYVFDVNLYDGGYFVIENPEAWKAGEAVAKD